MRTILYGDKVLPPQEKALKIAEAIRLQCKRMSIWFQEPIRSADDDDWEEDCCEEKNIEQFDGEDPTDWPIWAQDLSRAYRKMADDYEEKITPEEFIAHAEQLPDRLFQLTRTWQGSYDFFDEQLIIDIPGLKRIVIIGEEDNEEYLDLFPMQYTEIPACLNIDVLEEVDSTNEEDSSEEYSEEDTESDFEEDDEEWED